MSFERRILHHGSTPTGTPVVLTLQAVRKCWFELHRQGGCGSAELLLSNEFIDRDQIEIGHWISFEAENGARWYLGRVEERSCQSPALIRLRLEGMAIQLNEVFPGGFGVHADGNKPHRYAGTDLFTHDPDRSIETCDSVATASDIVRLLLGQYVTYTTQIIYDPQRVEEPMQAAPVTSLKFRGEESVRSILKELATRSQSASWGVDETGTFFFTQPKTATIAQYREGLDLAALTEVRDREHLFNRILLTGDYIYDRRDYSDMIARRSYRWRGNYVEPNSRNQHGERRIRIWLPWVRTNADAIAFASEFFRTYSQPVSRYLIETTGKTDLPRPWDGKYALYDQAGQLMTYAYSETVRVYFDHVPRFRMELGPLDPRELWPEPPQDERWELPDQTLSAGGDVSLPPTLPTGDPPPPPPPTPPLISGTPVSWSLESSLDSSGPTSSLVSSGPMSSLSSYWTSESNMSSPANWPWPSSGQGSSGATDSVDSSSNSSQSSSLFSSNSPSSQDSSFDTPVSSDQSLGHSSHSDGQSSASSGAGSSNQSSSAAGSQPGGSSFSGGGSGSISGSGLWSDISSNFLSSNFNSSGGASSIYSSQGFHPKEVDLNQVPT